MGYHHSDGAIDRLELLSIITISQNLRLVLTRISKMSRHLESQAEAGEDKGRVLATVVDSLEKPWEIAAVISTCNSSFECLSL